MDMLVIGAKSVELPADVVRLPCSPAAIRRGPRSGQYVDFDWVIFWPDRDVNSWPDPADDKYPEVVSPLWRMLKATTLGLNIISIVPQNMPPDQIRKANAWITDRLVLEPVRGGKLAPYTPGTNLQSTLLAITQMCLDGKPETMWGIDLGVQAVPVSSHLVNGRPLPSAPAKDRRKSEGRQFNSLAAQVEFEKLRLDRFLQRTQAQRQDKMMALIDAQGAFDDGGCAWSSLQPAAMRALEPETPWTLTTNVSVRRGPQNRDERALGIVFEYRDAPGGMIIGNQPKDLPALVRLLMSTAPPPVAAAAVDSTPAPDDFIGYKAAADYVGVTPRTVQQWNRDGLIKVIVLSPRRIRIPRAELDKFKKTR